MPSFHSAAAQERHAARYELATEQIDALTAERDRLRELLAESIAHIDSNTGGAGDADRIAFKAKARAALKGEQP